MMCKHDQGRKAAGKNKIGGGFMGVDMWISKRNANAHWDISTCAKSTSMRDMIRVFSEIKIKIYVKQNKVQDTLGRENPDHSC